jgi:hypothetical protein
LLTRPHDGDAVALVQNALICRDPRVSRRRTAS